MGLPEQSPIEKVGPLTLEIRPLGTDNNPLWRRHIADVFVPDSDKGKGSKISKMLPSDCPFLRCWWQSDSDGNLRQFDLMVSRLDPSKDPSFQMRFRVTDPEGGLIILYCSRITLIRVFSEAASPHVEFISERPDQDPSFVMELHRSGLVHEVTRF